MACGHMGRCHDMWSRGWVGVMTCGHVGRCPMTCGHVGRCHMTYGHVGECHMTCGHMGRVLGVLRHYMSLYFSVTNMFFHAHHLMDRITF